MILSKQLIEKGLKRVDELQDEIIQKSRQVDGAEAYVKEKMALFTKDEEIRNQLKVLRLKEKDLSESFFKAY